MAWRAGLVCSLFPTGCKSPAPRTGIQAEKQPVELTDLMPTVLELVGAKPPSTVQGQSLAPLLRGQLFSRGAPMISTKLAVPKARRGDRADLDDVAAAHPDVGARLKAGILRWMEERQAVKKRLGPSGTTRLDVETLNRLRSLGYLGGKEKP